MKKLSFTIEVELDIPKKANKSFYVEDFKAFFYDRLWSNIKDASLNLPIKYKPVNISLIDNNKLNL